LKFITCPFYQPLLDELPHLLLEALPIPTVPMVQLPLELLGRIDLSADLGVPRQARQRSDAEGCPDGLDHPLTSGVALVAH